MSENNPSFDEILLLFRSLILANLTESDRHDLERALKVAGSDTDELAREFFMGHRPDGRLGIDPMRASKIPIFQKIADEEFRESLSKEDRDAFDKLKPIFVKITAIVLQSINDSDVPQETKTSILHDAMKQSQITSTMVTGSANEYNEFDAVKNLFGMFSGNNGQHDKMPIDSAIHSGINPLVKILPEWIDDSLFTELYNAGYIETKDHGLSQINPAKSLGVKWKTKIPEALYLLYRIAGDEWYIGKNNIGKVALSLFRLSPSTNEHKIVSGALSRLRSKKGDDWKHFVNSERIQKVENLFQILISGKQK